MARSIKLHSSSLLYFIICMLGVAAFCLVGIYPNVAFMNELDASIVALNQTVQRQEMLFPAYSRLIKEVQRQAPDLPLPRKTKFPRSALTRIDTIFTELALKNKVILDHAVPDATSYLEDSGLLTLNLSFHGDFFNFQHLILDICQLPYLASIDELGIHPHAGGKQIVLKVKLDQE